MPAQQRKTVKSKVLIAVLLIIIVLALSMASTIFIFAQKQSRSTESIFFQSVLTIAVTPDKSEQTSYKQLEKCRKINENFSVPKIYSALYGFSIEEFDGFPVCVFNKDAINTVLYLHGGAFVYQPLVFHYDYCKRLAEKLQVKVVMPVYPKAPNYTYEKTIAFSYNMYLSLLATTSPDNIVFMGDSAGASLIMSLSQYIYDNNTPQPKGIFAFSPCVDLSLSNQDINNYAPLDPMLGLQDISIKMAPYIGDGDVTNPYISPYYCDFAVLPTMTVFVGTHEILLPDCRKLSENLKSKDIPFNYYEYPFMNHTFSIFPMPEGEECMEIVKNIWGI